MGRKHIVSGCTIVAYLPVSSSEPGAESSRTRNRVQSIISRYFCINHLLKSLAASVLEKLLCYTSNERGVLLHMFIAPYVADITELEDLLRVKRSSKTAMPGQMFEVKRESL